MAATSATNAWAVGYTRTAGPYHTMILHWNGRSWTRVRSPGGTFGNNATLDGVAATGGANAWAVGIGYDNTGRNEAFILHWNGTAWRQAGSPDLAVSTFLQGVAAASAGTARAVGSTGDTPPRALAIHCC